MENNPHKVPAGFFDSQKEEILDSVLNTTSTEQSSTRIQRFFKPALKIAAVLGTVILSNIVINKFTPDNCKTFACLLESTDLQSLSDTESTIVEEWEYELFDDYEYENLKQ